MKTPAIRSFTENLVLLEQSTNNERNPDRLLLSASSDLGNFQTFNDEKMKMTIWRGLTATTLGILLLCLTTNAEARIRIAQEKSIPRETLAYDPLEISEAKIKTLELTINDKSRGRELPVLVYLPKSKKQTAVIIHSHGLGGQKETSPFLGKHWAARGYVAVFLQHPGSDESIWKDKRPREIMAAFKKAADGENLSLRLGDVKATIDQLEKWNRDKQHALSERLNLKHIGMSGHSFGAVTTQNVSGQTGRGKSKCDSRITAAIPMSPSVPRVGDPAKAFKSVKIPWLCMTGTQDNSPIGNTKPESRLEVYNSLPVGDKYELVLHDAQHSVFTESVARTKQRQSKARNPNHHPAIKGITTAFWDAYLREDASAKVWLKSESVEKLLEGKDRWQSK
jgi:predicted dienelactone hydrolase